MSSQKVLNCPQCLGMPNAQQAKRLRLGKEITCDWCGTGYTMTNPPPKPTPKKTPPKQRPSKQASRKPRPKGLSCAEVLLFIATLIILIPMIITLPYLFDDAYTTEQDPPILNTEYEVPYYDCHDPEGRIVIVGYWDKHNQYVEYQRSTYLPGESLTIWNHPDPSAVGDLNNTDKIIVFGICYDAKSWSFTEGFHWLFDDPHQAPLPQPGSKIIFDPTLN